VTGDPVRVSVCHCLACQKRTGSAFSAQLRFAAGHVKIEGLASQWERTADSGHKVIYSFCPTCGSTVYYRGGNFDELVAIPLGAFEDPYFACPKFSVWEERQHPWVEILGDIEHSR
jgi:hypothetical protein